MFMDILALLFNLNQERLLKNNIMWENDAAGTDWNLTILDYL